MYCVLNIQVCLVHSSTTLSTLTTVLWLLVSFSPQGLGTRVFNYVLIPALLHYTILGCISHNQMTIFSETKSLPSSEIVRTTLFKKEHVKPWVCQKHAADMGAWKHTGSPSQYFQVRKNRFGGLMEIVSLGKRCPNKLPSDLYRTKKNYSSHHAATDLSCTVIFWKVIFVVLCVGQSKPVVYTYWDSVFRLRCSLTSLCDHNLFTHLPYKGSTYF